MSHLVLGTHDTAANFGRPLPVDLHERTALPGRISLTTLRLDRHLNGPRRSANGGFSAGTIARYVDADTVTVRLRRPIPLARDLHVAISPEGCRVHRGRRLVAEASPGRLDDGRAPVPPSFDEALAARDAHPLAGVRHALSDCVVCGPARSDGMRVTPGPVPGRPELLAAPWRVGTRDAVGGAAPFAAVWAAMDCPGYPADALARRELCLLGTMTAAVERRPRVGEDLVVYSWTRARRGRCYETSTALIDADGARVARADSIWVAVRHQRTARILSRLF